LDKENSKSYLFEASPDLPSQMKMLKQFSGAETEFPNGIFLTHAHIGHYTGLMYFGREATNADKVPVYAMPKMKKFLEKNGPWDQLISLENIEIKEMTDESTVTLSSNISIVPMKVPHRDEYSETVGYKIIGPNKSAIFIPDIDKWSKWNTNIKDLIKEVDYAFLDATFFDSEEINNRDIAEIPHPFVIESMSLFKDLSSADKKKIHFIHFNHTNPLLDENSKASKEVLNKGFNIARMSDIFEL
jgi:pyrroloquinoline quinone biosynthesis protein B